VRDVVAAQLRVAIVAPPWYEVPPEGYGGVERVCAVLVEGLVARGHAVTLIGAGHNHTRANFVQTLAQAPGEESGQHALVEITHAARALDAIGRLRPDVVHDHSLAGPLGAQSYAAPTVVTAHMPLAGPESQLEYFEAISRGTALVALSEAQRSDAPHLPWVGVNPNGIDVEAFPFRKRKDDYVLYLGRISATKGVGLAIRAARQAGRRLVIAGKGSIPAETTYFQEQILPEIGGDVEWVGEVSGQPRLELLSRAQCLIFPICWREPFGLVLIEAMACGTPVVALAEGSVPEIVEHGRTGVLCQEPAELPAAIEASSHLEPRECRNQVKRRFTAEHMVGGYEAVYRRVLQAG
jgi:glycosyltransferase involved in cell wall biosynthesis